VSVGPGIETRTKIAALNGTYAVVHLGGIKRTRKQGQIEKTMLLLIKPVIVRLAASPQNKTDVEVKQEPGTGRGPVPGPDGQPVADATVELQVFAGGDVNDMNNYRAYIRTADSNGLCVFEDAEPGSAHIARLFQIEDGNFGTLHGLRFPLEIKPDTDFDIIFGG